MQPFHEGDLVQVIAPYAPRFGEFAKVVRVVASVHVRFVFGNSAVIAHSPDELKLIRAAHKPGWERHGFKRNVHKWRFWRSEHGWVAVQPVQCETPLFRTGYGVGRESYRSALAELELAILKGKAALDLQEALS